MKKTQKNNSAGILLSGVFFTRALWCIAAAAVLLRFGVALELSTINHGINSVLAPSVQSDLCTYIRLGQEIACGVFPKEFYYQPFYYAVFLPLIYLVTGCSLWAVIVIQSLLGGATAFLCGLIGKQLFGRAAGLIGAGFCALSVPLLLYAPFHQNETLQSFNLTLLAFLLLRALRKPEFSRRWAAVGVMAGVAILTRGQIWLLLPVLLAGVLFVPHVSLKRKALNTAWMLGVLLLLQLPFSLYNSIQRKQLCGPSTAADAVLALGNTPEAPPGGRNADLPAGPMEYTECFHRFMANSAKGISVPRQMLAWLFREPGAFIELQFRKLLLFWDYRELPNNVSLAGEGRYSRILQLDYPGSSGILLALALGGIFYFARRLFKKHALRLWMLYGMVIFYWGATSAFYILSRFRAPILPLCAVFSGAMAVVLLRKKGAKLHAVFCTLCGAFLTFSAYGLYADFCEPAVMRLVRAQGTLIDCGGKPLQRIDHGPFTCGKWFAVPLKENMRIGKKFAGVNPHQKGSVEWSLFAESSGTLEIKVRERIVLCELKQGLNKLTLPADSPGITVEVLRLPCPVAAPADGHRRYNRSFLNDETVSGEWIMRLIYYP